MKMYNEKRYVHAPEERFGSCIGCIAQNDESNFTLCDAIRDENFCRKNGFKIYKELKQENEK